MRKCIVAGDWVMEKTVGVQRYTFQILRVIDQMITNHECEYEFELLIPKNVYWPSPFKNIKIVHHGLIKSKVGKHIWQQIVFPAYIRRNKAIGIDMAAALPIWGCDIIAIHDCIHEAYPENFAGHKLYNRIYLAKVRKIVRKKSVRIITLTYDSKKEIQKYYDVPESRLSIVGCGWEHMNDIPEDTTILQRLGLNETDSFFFSLGSRYKHKNYTWVLKVARYNPHYKFVITGTDSYSNTINDLMIETPDNVIYTGYLSDNEIKTLYKSSVALIQPSYYEGFGLPPLEVLSVGGRAIVSNASCLPEIYGDTVLYIDPYVYEYNLEEMMGQNVSDSSVVLEKYTWEKAALKLVDAIRMVKK